MKEYQSMLQAVNKVVKEDHRMYFLDLSDPVQFLCVAEQFGGQEHIKREYPHFWELLERTREYHACYGVSGEIWKNCFMFMICMLPETESFLVGGR